MNNVGQQISQTKKHYGVSIIIAYIIIILILLLGVCVVVEYIFG